MKKLLLETSFSKIYIIGVILISLLIIGSYFSYAMFTVTKEKNNAISIVTGSLDYKLTVDGEETNTLTIPANTTKEFIITLSNPNSIRARFNFYFISSGGLASQTGYIMDCETNSMPEAKGVNLEKSGTSGSSNVYKIMVENNNNMEETITLGVEVGLDYNDLSLPRNGNLFTEYVDIPNEPELSSGMIAVTYDGSNWVKADTTNSNNSWYNYEEQKWANAVTVSSSTRSTYNNASVGTVINMNDIETMWVWIPRYSYTIGSSGGTNYYGKKGCYLESEPTKELPGEIDIVFVDTNVKHEGTARYNTSAGSREYYTPDAFTFDGEELSGFWVGKFEASSTTPDAVNGGGSNVNLDAMIKPDVMSWGYINLVDIHTVVRRMTSSSNRYGLSTTYDSHITKNSEWGAGAYLFQSKYGKLGNTDYTGTNKEIFQGINYVTGLSSGEPTYQGNGTSYSYDVDINGTGASTTGTIYGIYGMNGNRSDYVMGNYNKNLGNSSFSTLPDAKYYDLYTTTNVNTACNGNRCISHALDETSGWYNDIATFFTQTNVWLIRGGKSDYQDGTAGIFGYTPSDSRIGFRISLVTPGE